MAKYKSGAQLSGQSVFIWRMVQGILWIIGAVIFLSLVFFPSIGITLFWNVLIPIAPALIAVATGLWRNVCPLATTALLPRKLNFSKRKIMSQQSHGMLSLISIILLYLIVPLRHAVFNVNGMATAVLLVITTSVAVAMGFYFEWKSAWCSSLCPVHTIEKLYGSNTAFTLPNAHCQECMKCVSPCPDSTANAGALSNQKSVYHQITSALLIGGLPGFIWGWFHVPDEAHGFSFSTIGQIYLMPLAAMVATLILYLIITGLTHAKHDRMITALFSATAVSCYYWYRIPALVGFGKFAEDGMLIDLSKSISYEWVAAAILLTTAFFFWWIVIRKPNRLSWTVRPAYGSKVVIE